MKRNTGLLILALFATPCLQASDWASLEPFQETISKEDFIHLTQHIYDPNNRLGHYIDLNENNVLVYETIKKSSPPIFKLKFAKESQKQKIKHKDIRIYIDPGHIGGDFAEMEHRHFLIKKYRRDGMGLKEGNMTLIVAKLIKNRLIKNKFTVLMSKEDLQPVTKEDPKNYQSNEKEFYRKSEISARAQKARAFDPDLNVCLHFNVGRKDHENEPWTKNNRLMLFVHGSYLADEIDDPKQRFELFRKILEGSHQKELEASNILSKKLKEATGLAPPEDDSSSEYFHRINENPYIYARNLAANRLFPGPTVYLEPYYQNNQIVYCRLVAGDYAGVRLVYGKFRKSIYREYADAVAEGIIEFFSEQTHKNN